MRGGTTTRRWTLTAWMLFTGVVQSASIYTESFSSGAADWLSSGGLQVAAVDETLRGQFAAQTFPFPESGAFVATNASSGGAFVGDYPAADIQLVGFSFMAETVLPSAALVRWSGPTSSFFRSFASLVTQTCVWYHVAISLRDKDAGRWVGDTAQAFDEGLLDVQRLEIQLTRAGMTAQRYYLDNVFLDALPVGMDLSLSEVGCQVSWSRLRTNVAYVVQSAVDPTANWVPADVFVATGRTHAWLDESATNALRRVYRLVFPQSQP